MTPAIGFRVWRIGETLTGPRLVSPNRNSLWLPGIRLEAECWTEAVGGEHGRLAKAHRNQPELRPPVQACTCGIYAYHSTEDMANALQTRFIGGAVLCWGRITIHREGIRAQFARPLALSSADSFSPSTDDYLAELAAGYGVPLLDLSHLELYAREFGERYEPVADPPTAWGRQLTRSMRDAFARWF